MTCHLKDDTEECFACEAFDRGYEAVNVKGEPSKPLCRRHFNAMLAKVHGQRS